MPSYKTLTYAAGASWTVTTGLLVAEQVGAHIGAILFAYFVAVAGTLTVIASLTYLQLTAIAPVREAFTMGYELSNQHHAAAERSRQPGTDLARVLRPPAGTWTVNEQPRPPAAAVGEARAASQHRAKPPWSRGR